MKNLALTLLLSICTQFSFAQSNFVKVIISDSTGLVNLEMKEIIKGFLYPAGVESADYLDYTKRCEYYFATFRPKAEDFELSIKDCEREIIGKKTIYGEIKLTSKEDMGKALASEIVSILKSDTSISFAIVGDGTKEIMINHHDSRHYFAPTAYNLKKGELYYSTYFGLVHEFQYGLSDNFSLGGGSSVALIPIFVTPKFSFKLGEKANFAIGDLFVAGTYAPFQINIAYGALTLGSRSNNVTFSGGAVHTSFSSSIFPQGALAVLNFSTMQSFSRYVYFLSENYFIPRNNDANNANAIFAGFTGLRFIQKKKDVSSFQLGIAYLYLNDGFFEPTFIPLPAISYTHKFGTKL